MRTDMWRVRAGRAWLALALAGVTVACQDILDPPEGFDFSVELEVPDTVVLGSEFTAVLRITDSDGRSVTGLPVLWALNSISGYNPPPPPVFELEQLPEPSEVKVTSVRAGGEQLYGGLTGKPAKSPVSSAQTIWSVATGVRIRTAEGTREIELRLGRDTVVSADLVGIDGQVFVEAGNVAWRTNPQPYAYIVGLTAQSRAAIRLRSKRVGTVALIARAAVCSGVCEDTIAVKVVQVPATLTIEPGQRLTYLGQRLELAISVIDTEGQAIPDAPVEWSLLDEADSIIVSFEGNVAVARRNGSAQVVARLGEVADTATIEVRQMAYRVDVEEPLAREMLVGSRDTLDVHVFDCGGHPLELPYTLTATTSDPAVVDVAVIGDKVELIARAPGVATVFAFADGANGYGWEVTVNPLMDDLQIRLGRDTLTVIGGSTSAEAWGLVDGEWIRVLAAITSSNTAVATVESDGRVYARGAGTAWIRTHAAGWSDSALIVVSQVLAHLGLEPNAPNVAIGGTIPMRAIGFDSAGVPIPSVDATFTSSEPAILSIDASGTATAQALGEATVTATAGTVSAHATVTVVPPVAAAAVGDQHACFIVQGGGLYCVGRNGSGALGDGTTIDRLTPVSAGGTLAFAQVAAGDDATCGITLDGATHCWGGGELGRNNPWPVRVTGDPGFERISLFAWHACGLTEAGEAYCWGSNDLGELGVGHTNPVDFPTRVAGAITFRAIAVGANRTCAVAQDGGAYCWGYLDGPMATWPTPLTSTHSFIAIDALGCAIATDGTLHCRNGLELQPVQDGRTYRAIVAGHNFHCAEGTDGGVYCFGQNDWGQLGTGDQEPRPAPARALLAGAPTFTVAGWLSACAGNAAGGLACWGDVGWTGIASPYPQPLVHPAGASVPLPGQSVPAAGRSVRRPAPR